MKSNLDRQFNICVLTIPSETPTLYVLLSNVLRVLRSVSKNLYLISARVPPYIALEQDINVIDIKTALHYRQSLHPMWLSTLFYLIKLLLIPIKMSIALIKISRRVDVVITYVGTAWLILPIVIARVLRKKVVLLTGTIRAKPVSLFDRLTRMLEGATFYLCDLIVPHTKGCVDNERMGKYQDKVLPLGARFVDTTLFSVQKDVEKRGKVVGFLGRLSQEKGIINFVEAIPLIVEQHNDIEFSIAGGGTLLSEVRTIIEKYGNTKVSIHEWIPHDEAPAYLNGLRLLVVPSYVGVDDLPSVMLEAMACGTPVLATPIAGIVDVIKDGETGFILDNNSPESIARNVIRVLGSLNLSEVAKNGHSLIEQEYSYTAAVERYRKIMNSLGRKK